MSKELEKLKLPSRITSFPDVERMIKSLEARFHKIESSIKKPAEKDVKETEGETGDTKISRNVDGTYTFELKTKEGWKVPTYGGTAVNFDNKPPLVKAKIKKDLDTIVAEDAEKGQNIAQKTIYDEKNEKFDVSHLTGVPRPDYDSGWFFWDYSDAEEQNDGAYQLTHDLGVLPTLIKVYFAVGQGSGALGDKVEDSLVTNFQEITNGFSATWSSSSWDRIGTVWNVTNTTLRMVSGDSYSVVTASDWSGAAPAGYVKATDGAMKVLIWK